jgi:ribosomal-protein-alanine N-acetyltransferase
MLEDQKNKNELDLNLRLESDVLYMVPVWNIDSEEMAKQANNLDTACAVGERFPFPYKIEDADGFKEHAKNSWENGKEFSFGIYEKDTGKYIGNIGFGFNGENKNIISNIGYWLGTEFHRKGYATEAMKVVVEFIKKQFPDVVEMHVGAHHYNEASIKILEKFGFVKTGETEDYGVLRNGKQATSIKFINKLK